MATIPVCRKCPVVAALNKTIKEYELFITVRSGRKPRGLTDHAKGFLQGQCSVVEDLIQDLQVLKPFLQAEANLRAKSDKGL